MVIWITGLSASGKTTLSKAFEKEYKSQFPNMVLLDGDVIRQLYGNDLGYVESDRKIQIQRIQSIAVFLEQQGIIVLVAALYANEEILKRNRELFKEYYEVYLKAEISSLQKREIKEIYKQALEKKMSNVVGIDIPYFEPVDPFILFHVEDRLTPDVMAKILHNKIFAKGN
jgi:cytidine diphosphoramidate kinase